MCARAPLNVFGVYSCRLFVQPVARVFRLWKCRRVASTVLVPTLA